MLFFKTALKAQALFLGPAGKAACRGNEYYYPHVMDRGENKEGLGSCSELVRVLSVLLLDKVHSFAVLSLMVTYLSFQLCKKYFKWKNEYSQNQNIFNMQTQKLHSVF